MPPYIEISQTGNIAGALRYRVRLSDDVLDDGYSQPVEFEPATLDGGPVLSFGPGSNTFSYLIQFPYTGAPAGYANYADVRALFVTNTIAGNQLVMRTMQDAIRNVVLVNKGAFRPRCLTFEKYTSAAIYEILLQLQQRP